MERAVLFDCDGVLVDSEPLLNALLVEMFAQHGIHYSLPEFMKIFVGGSKILMEFWMRTHHNFTIPDSFWTEYRNRQDERVRTHLKPISGIHSVISWLNAAGLSKRAVASNSRLAYLELSLGCVDLKDHFFPHVSSSQMVENPKPSPEVYLLAAARLGVEPSQCIVVEDSPSGVRAGVAAGMTVLGFTAGGHCLENHGDKLLEVGAQDVCANAQELIQKLNQILFSKGETLCVV